MRDPRCTLTVGAPGGAVVGVLAEELRRRHLRVTLGPDGCFLRARSRWPRVLNVVALAVLAPPEFSGPALRARVVEDHVGGSTVLVWTNNVGWSTLVGPRLYDAVNATALRFLHNGVGFSASPWERTPATWNWKETFEDMV